MTRFLAVELAAPDERIDELGAFYTELFESAPVPGGHAFPVGETVLSFAPVTGRPFFHFALLVPGDRFAAALAWIGERVELLPDRTSGDRVFDFPAWKAQAVYFHDPVGNIVELIAHRGIDERGTAGPFSPAEIVGLSEVGIVCDPTLLAPALRQTFGLEVWDGSMDEGRLAFVGQRGRTLILGRPGRGWLPTGRPAEAHRMRVILDGAPAAAQVTLPGGGVLRRGRPSGGLAPSASPPWAAG